MTAPTIARGEPLPATAVETLPRLLRKNALAVPDAVALRHKDLGLWREYTWAEYAERTARVGLTRHRCSSINNVSLTRFVVADELACFLGVGRGDLQLDLENAGESRLVLVVNHTRDALAIQGQFHDFGIRFVVGFVDRYQFLIVLHRWKTFLRG